MLNVETFNNIFDIFTLQTSSRLNKIIVPSINEIQNKYGESQGLSEFLREHSERELRPDWKLMLDLSNLVFKKEFPHKSKEYFFLSMEIFRDLRSYTIDIDLLAECLEMFDDTTKKAVTLFWEYINQEDFLDEDKAYYNFTQKLIHDGIKCDKENIFFIGHQHMTAHQVDLVKALSINHNVYVPLNQYQYNHALDTDWVSWFDIKKRKSNHLSQKKNQAKLLIYPKNRLAETICDFIQGEKKADIVLAQKNPDFYHYNEIAVSDASFISHEDIFGPIVNEIFEEVSLKSFSKGLSFHPYYFKEMLDKECKRELSKKDEQKNFRRIKILVFFKEMIDEWVQVSGKEAKMTDLDIEIFKQAAAVRLPKVYAKKLIRHTHTNIFGMDGMPIESDAEINILIASSNYNSFEQDTYRYGPRVMEVLASLGPIRRKGFEILFFKSKIFNFLSRKNAMLCIEEGLFKESPFWGELKEEVDFIPISIPYKTKAVVKDYLRQEEKTHYRGTAYSATKLQTYIDCPRKFYYTYVEKFDQQFHSLNSLSYGQRGILEHAAIRDVVENRGNLRDVVEKTLNNFLIEKGLAISSSNYLLYFEEILQNTMRGVSFINQLKETLKISQCFLELPVDDGIFSGGQADFVAKSPYGRIVIDFKRSQYGVPREVNIEKREKIQILYYVSHLKIKIDDLALVGFFCLSDPKESYLISKDPNLSFGDISVKPMKDKIRDSFLMYPQDEKNCVEDIEQDRHFFAQPRNPTVCHYCHLKQICPRETLQ